MYRYIKASFDNDIPNWLRDDKRALSALNNAGVDLKNAIYSKDRAGKVGDNYAVYLINGTKFGPAYRPFVWIPGVYNDDESVKGENQYDWRSGRSFPKYVAVKYIAKKNLDIADVIYINKASNGKQYREKYQDPRTFGRSTRYHYAGGKEGEYAGQRYEPAHTTWKDEEVPGKWVTPSGRDKSGYEIPNPRKRLEEFYNTPEGATRQVRKAKKQLDGMYSQLTTLKSRIKMLTPSGDELGSAEQYGSIGKAYDYFGDAVNYYNNAIKALESIEERPERSTWMVDQALSSLERCQDRIDRVNEITLRK